MTIMIHAAVRLGGSAKRPPFRAGAACVILPIIVLETPRAALPYGTPVTADAH